MPSTGLVLPVPAAAIQGVLAEVVFNEAGLVPAIAQQHDTGEVLMMAWMNREAIAETLTTGRVCYWSRSRKSLWRKGETSGHVQKLVDFIVDCDGDTLLLKVNQTGPACHTGERSCFFRGPPRQGDGGLARITARKL
ncbi:MAG: phosphoribosyl-AMP cyclohydrolase [Alphaproteobacteria bacterium]|nr:phosphoribosyl-AMP cyclohydrolase [Alphaproteobacteria bacterium]